MRRTALLACVATLVLAAPPSAAVAQDLETADYAAVLDPETGDFRRYHLPPGAGPHNLIVGDDGIVWYAGNLARHIGRLDPATGEVRLADWPTRGSRPYGIVQAPDDVIRVAAFGTNKLLRADDRTMVVEEVTLPRPEARPRRVEVTRDGRIWYGDYAAGKLGVYDPRTRQSTGRRGPCGSART